MFSVVQPSSFNNVQAKWMIELTHYIRENLNIILVGTKIDLRDDEETKNKLLKQNEKPLTYEEGVSEAATIKAHCYMECSAKKKIGVKEIFDRAIQISLQSRKPDKHCLIL